MTQTLSPYIPLTITAISEVAPGFKTLSFAEGHGINYEPGQYLTFIDKPGLQEIRRSYSVLSIPFLNEPLTIGVKRIENGHFSRKLVDRIRIGDTLYSSGAGGFFRLPDNISEVNSIVLFAAGSGITPVYSLIKSALYSHPHLKVTLFYSNHSLTTTAFYEQLKSLCELFTSRLTVHFLFSNIKELSQARLTRDRLIGFIIAQRNELNNTFFFTCGPESYMMKVMFVLQEHGVLKDHIRKEEFVSHRTRISRSLPPDKHSRMVTISHHSDHYTFKVNYPDTILEAAKKKQIALPYSCETGKCGSCAVLCLKGKLWLSNNEVLTDADLRKGLTLTCVGHPVDGDVELKILEI